MNFERIDTTAFSSGALDEPGNDLEYWLSKTPGERLEAVEFLRQMMYGYDPATGRLQRVFEIADLSSGRVSARGWHRGGDTWVYSGDGGHGHLDLAEP